MNKFLDAIFDFISKPLTKKIYLAVVYIILYAPIIVLIIFSFNAGKRSGMWQGFSFKWYHALFSDRQIMKALYYTLIIAVISSAFATLLGTFAAYGIHNYRSKQLKRVVLSINNIPVLNPDIVTGVSLMVWFLVIFKRLMGINNGFLTVLVAHITFCIPYVVLSVLPKLKQMPKSIIEAAQDLGAKPFEAFYKVVLPEITPGIVSGALISFTLSVDDFVISFFTTGSGIQNLSISIFSMARKGISPKVNALSALMFISVIVLMFIVSRRTNIQEL